MLLSWPSRIRNYATPPTGGDWHNSFWLSRVFSCDLLRGDVDLVPMRSELPAPHAVRSRAKQKRDLRPVLFDAADWHAYPSVYHPIPRCRLPYLHAMTTSTAGSMCADFAAPEPETEQRAAQRGWVRSRPGSHHYVLPASCDAWRCMVRYRRSKPAGDQGDAGMRRAIYTVPVRTMNCVANSHPQFTYDDRR
jgi:hypothetical protein